MESLSQWLRRKNFTANFQGVGYDAKKYGFHSCQSGGASTLAGHVTKYELLNAGRWKSARSLSHYVKIPEKRMLQFSDLLSG